MGLAAGTYVYTGSARRGLEARLARHLRSSKRLHWHVDHLLAVPGVRIVAVRRSRLAECRLQALTPGRPVLPGFGASDCRAGCGSHLRRVGAAMATASREAGWERVDSSAGR